MNAPAAKLASRPLQAKPMAGTPAAANDSSAANWLVVHDAERARTATTKTTSKRTRYRYARCRENQQGGIEPFFAFPEPMSLGESLN